MARERPSGAAAATDMPAFAAEDPGHDDVAMAFVVFLGRETTSERDLVLSGRHDWRGLLIRFIGSPEFLTQVVPHLLAGTAPRSDIEETPDHLRAMAAWMAGVAKGAGLPTEAELAAAPSWPAMLVAWLRSKAMIALLCPRPGNGERDVAAAWVLDALVERS